MFINFCDIPGNHNLFLDYLYEFDNVKDFYKTNFRNKEEYLKTFAKVAGSHGHSREQLVNALNRQYRDFNISAKTRKNISALGDNKTLAVVTGQQLGIMGGPLYTLYKIITAIKLSSSLSDRYDDYHFVPVFWLEADDHDFNEVREIKLLNENNEIKKIAYDNELLEDENKGSVGSLAFNESLNAFFTELEGSLRNTEYTAALIEKLKSVYSIGKTFKQSFRELIFWLFDQYGLIIFDPQDLIIKELLKPIFKKEITDFRMHTEKLVSVSARLEELYHAQVKVRPVNLFYSFEEGRHLIEPVENEFRLKRKRKKFTPEELLAAIENEPGNFSPNVLLRPVCQDYILPTALYVGGPSEIAYFAQIMPLYDFYNIEAPVIYPRSSATIIEKFDIDINQLLHDPERLKKKIIDSISNSSIDEIFNDTAHNIEKEIDRLKEKLFEFDKTLSDSTAKYSERILRYVNELKGKALEAQNRKFETTLRQIDKVINSILPESVLQEREINFIYFANKYSLEILKHVFDELSINKFEHQIISL